MPCGCQSLSAVNLNLVVPLCQIVTFLHNFPSSLNSLTLPRQQRGAELRPGASHWARMLPWSSKAVVALSPGYSASGIRPCRHTRAYTHVHMLCCVARTTSKALKQRAGCSGLSVESKSLRPISIELIKQTCAPNNQFIDNCFVGGRSSWKRCVC